MKQVALIYQEPLSLVAVRLSDQLIEKGFIILAIDSFANTSIDGITLILYGAGAKQDLLGFRQTWINTVRQQRQVYLVVVGDEPETNLPVQLRRLTRLRLSDESVESINTLVNELEDVISRQTVTIKATAVANAQVSFVESKAAEIHQNLRTSWARAAHEATTNSIFFDSLSYQMYESSLEANLTVLRQRLVGKLAGNRESSGLLRDLYCLRFPKSTDKTSTDMRELYFAPAETNLILQWLCDQVGYPLELVMNDRYGEHRRVSYANRMSGNPEASKTVFLNWVETHRQFKRDIRAFASSHPDSWYYRGDIRRFYPTVPRDSLLDKVRESLPEERQEFLPLLREFLELGALYSDGTYHQLQGLPAGIALSHVLANFYLLEVDAVMTEQALDGGYFRYADDVFIFGTDANHATALENEYVRALSSVGLERHPDKRHIGTSENSDLLASQLDGLSAFLNPPDPQFLSQHEKRWYGENIYSIVQPSLKTGNTQDTLAHEDNEEALARYGATVVRLLDSLEYDENDVDQLAFDLLRKVALRAHHIRRLVEYLVKQFRVGYSQSEVGRQFFDSYLHSEASDYVQVAFLQVLREQAASVSDSKIWESAFKLSESKSIYVSGECALSLSSVPSELLTSLSAAREKGSVQAASENPYTRARQLHYWYNLDKIDPIVDVLKSSNESLEVTESARYLLAQEAAQYVRR